MQRSQNIFDIEQSQLFAIIKQRSLEREIDLVRQELEVTERKTTEFQHKVIKYVLMLNLYMKVNFSSNALTQ